LVERDYILRLVLTAGPGVQCGCGQGFPPETPLSAIIMSHV